MKADRPTRAAYAHFQQMTTRLRDNDFYHHMNNAVYYEYFDTILNQWLMEKAGMEIPGGAIIGLAVETRCAFFASLEFPDLVNAGMRVGRVGRSSVTYEIALFRNDEDLACAGGHFIHVYVDAKTRRPAALPERLRAALGALRV